MTTFARGLVSPRHAGPDLAKPARRPSGDLSHLRGGIQAAVHATGLYLVYQLHTVNTIIGAQSGRSSCASTVSRGCQGWQGLSADTSAALLAPRPELAPWQPGHDPWLSLAYGRGGRPPSAAGLPVRRSPARSGALPPTPPSLLARTGSSAPLVQGTAWRADASSVAVAFRERSCLSSIGTSLNSNPATRATAARVR